MSDNKNSFRISIKNLETVSSQPEHSLLESLELHKIEMQYHCREGFCGACRTKLLAGQVEYTSDPLAYIDDDEILPCCCFPLSDLDIEIN